MKSENFIQLTLLIIFPATLMIGCCLCSVGVSSRRRLDPVLMTSGLSSIDLTETDLTKLCQRVGVHGRGRKSCSRSAEVAGVLVEAAWVGVTHCQHLMKFDRWNCSLGPSRLKIMRNAFRETAFLQGMSAAALTHVVSRACAAGRLSRCSCDDYSAAHIENLKVWRWGGCGDNLKYGSRFARQIFTAETKKNKRGHRLRVKQSILSTSVSKPLRSQAFKSLIDAHNAQVGVQIVVNATGRSCKCHGVSGSCTMKTCWNQLTSFIASADTIKSLYVSAFQINTNNEAQLIPKTRQKKKKSKRPQRAASTGTQQYRRQPLDNNESDTNTTTFGYEIIMQEHEWESNTGHRRRRKAAETNEYIMGQARKRNTSTLLTRPRKKKPSRGLAWDTAKLVYQDRSPNFCRQSRYSPGTQERRCEKGKNCETLCCGRGYDTIESELHEPCKCNVVWCCKVQCRNCTRSAEIYTCK